MEEALAARLRDTHGSIPARITVWARAVADVVSFAARGRVGGGLGAGIAATARDFGYATRSLRHAPGFTAVAVATLAIGIAASTATFSVVYPVLLQSPPYADSDRLVVVWPEANVNKALVGLAAEQMPSLEQISGISDWTLTLTGAGEPLELTGTLVSPNHFELLGVRPFLGRGFAPEHELPERAGVVVLSHDLWVSAFGSDPTIVGRMVDLAGAQHERREVIGVMPPNFVPLGTRTQVWVPLQGDPAVSPEEDASWYVNTRIARLTPTATIARAGAEVRAFAAEIQARMPENFDDEQVRGATVRSLAEHRAGGVGTALRLTLGSVSLVLLMACANLANLLLARGEARNRELAVRAALGAGRRRIARLLLMETMALGILGGGLGVAGAYALVQILVAQAPQDFPGVANIGVNGPVLGYAAGTTLLAVLLAGLVPTRRASRVETMAMLGGSARGTGARGRAPLGNVLVGVQVAFALMITVGSGLMLRSLGALLAVDPGIEPAGVVAFRANPPAGRYPDGLAYREYYARITEQVAALPGIESVGAIQLLPGTNGNWSFPTYPEGIDVPDGTTVPSVNFRATRIGYFQTVRLPLVAGRLLDDTDGADAENVVMVNEAFVRRFWPGEDPLGRSLRIFSATASPSRIVGVVGDVRQHDRSMEPQAEMYFTHAQVPWNEMSMWLLARASSGDPLDLAAPIREAVWSVDADVPISGMQDLSATMIRSTESTRFLALLLSGFGAIALGLGAVGIFGVTAYTVGRRAPEFGVRVALGSSRAGIVTAAMRRSLQPVGFGLLAGVAGALATSNLLESVLYGVETTDPATLIAVPALLAAIATGATVAPAWRASRVDPIRVLNSN